MILGLSAAFIGIFYAFFKFGAHRYLRRLRNNISQAQHDQRRNAKRLAALEDKLKVNRSKKHSLERETQRLQHETDSLYNYLKSSLPGGLHDEVDRCRARSPEPDRNELKLLHDLKMTDHLSEALAPLSMLAIEARTEAETAKILFRDELTAFLKKKDVRFHSPQATLVICLFDHPDTALELVRQFTNQLSSDRLIPLAAGLYTGVHVSDEKGAVGRLLAGTLHHATDLKDNAPDFALVMNEKAYQTLSDQKSIEHFNVDSLTYIVSLVEQKEQESESNQ